MELLAEMVALCEYLAEEELGYDLSWCAYARRGEEGQNPMGTCSFGCVDEPSCITDCPREGWPRERAKRVLSQIRPKGGEA